MEKVKENKLTCPHCNNAVYIHHEPELLNYFLETEKVGHQCSICGTNVIINKQNLSVIEI